jgi:hypothetical protein
VTDTAPPTPTPLTDEEREQLLLLTAELGAYLQQITAAVMPAFQAIAQGFAQLQSALQGAGLIDADGKPVRRTDRPAWQSPYGPPTTRH